MFKKYDLIVIGAGSGGLTAAIGGAKIGARVLLINKDGKLGGDCTNFGCIPSKTLIKTARVVRLIRDRERYGIFGGCECDYEFNLKKALEHVQEKVSYFTNGADSIKHIESYGVDVLIGEAKFIDNKTIKVDKKEYEAKYIIIATGAKARIPEIKGSKTVKALTNHNIFLPRTMKSITVIGGGPIACELGQAFRNLGLAVNIVQRAERLLNVEDIDASTFINDQFIKDGIKIFTDQEVVKFRRSKGKKIVMIRDKENDEEEELESDEILLAVGRIPNIEGLNLERAGVEYNEKGIITNKKTQTSQKNIYAIGDVAGGYQFTHFADHQAKVAIANALLKIPKTYEEKVIPRITFTHPEVASVGINEQQMRENHPDYILLEKSYNEIDRAITESNPEGFVKIIVDKKGYIKGAVIVGERAGELIAELTLAMKNNLNVTKISDTIHAYPSFSYGVRSCADLFRTRKFTKKKREFLKRIYKLRG